MKRQQPSWNSVDWSLRDVDIAGQVCRTRERVRQVRVALGKPKSIFHNQRRTKPAPELNFFLSNRDAARAAGVKPAYVCRERKKAGAPPSPRSVREGLKAKQIRHLLPHYPDIQEVARLAGVTLAYAYRIRAKQ